MTRIIAATVVLLLLAVVLLFGVEWFTDGFETGDFTNWTTSTGSTIESTSPIRTGSYSAELVGGDVLIKDSAAANSDTAYFVGYYYLASYTFGSIFLRPRIDGADASNLYLRLGGSSIQALNFGGTCGVLSFAAPTGQWVKLEWLYTKGTGSDAKHQIWFDDVEKMNCTDGDETTQVDGWKVQKSGGAPTMHWDDIEFHDSIPSGVAARVYAPIVMD